MNKFICKILCVFIFVGLLFAVVGRVFDSEKIKMVIDSTIFLLLIIELYFTRETFFVDNKYREREKAVELSKYFQEELLNLASIFGDLFSELDWEYKGFIDSIDINEMKVFNERELKIFFQKKSKNIEDFTKKYEELIESENYINKFFENYSANSVQDFKLFRKHLSVQNALKMVDKIGEEGLEKFCKESGNKDFDRMLKELKMENDWMKVDRQITLMREKNDLLNKLEYFAMNFVKGIADEEVVYTSLHNAYRAVVKSLYIDICLMNKAETDEYYNNVICLFKIWNDRYNKDLEDAKNNNSKKEKKPDRFFFF